MNPKMKRFIAFFCFLFIMKLLKSRGECILKLLRRILLIVILAIPLLFLSSCAEAIPEPKINFFHDSKKLNEIYYGNLNNKKQEEIEREIQYEMIGRSFVDLPAVTLGDAIQIEAVNFETDEFKVYDYIVDEKGKIISDYEMETSTILPAEDGRATFLFENDGYLDDYSGYAIEGSLVHYLLIRCKIDNSSFAFGTFVLETFD